MSVYSMRAGVLPALNRAASASASSREARALGSEQQPRLRAELPRAHRRRIGERRAPARRRARSAPGSTKTGLRARHLGVDRDRLGARAAASYSARPPRTAAREPDGAACAVWHQREADLVAVAR